VSTQLYGGDIYLLGGSHFFMKDQAGKTTEVGQGASVEENAEMAANAKFS